jgi:hypothetical protein
MKKHMFRLSLAGLAILFGLQLAAAQQAVTLYAPWDKAHTKYDEKRAWFSFEYGVRGTEDKRISGDEWGDLGYGFMAINDEDWFTLGPGRDDRSVIKDLGVHTWFDSFVVPQLTPLPKLAPGAERQITVDASADTHKKWAETNGIFAKIVVGHVYAVHVRRGVTDFYTLFRVEQHEQQAQCTISWKRIPAPETKAR